MSIFQNLQINKKTTKLELLTQILLQIQNKFEAKEVYYMEFDESSSFCVKHIGTDKDCSNFHRSLVDKLERISYEENIPVVVMDTSKDPRTINSNLSNKNYSILVLPVKNKGLSMGTLTVIRDKKFDIKDLNELQLFTENISFALSSKFSTFDKNEFSKEISKWLIEKIGTQKKELLIDQFLGFLSSLSIDVNLSVVFDDEYGYNNLPCQINNWNILKSICPALKKDKYIESGICKFSKNRGFICSKIESKPRKACAVFSFSDLTHENDQSWNEIFINLFYKFILIYYSINKIDSVIVYDKIFEIVKDLIGTEKFTLDNSIAKISDSLFDLLDNAAVYAYSLKSKSNFEFIKINPKYQNYSNLIFEYTKFLKNKFPNTNFNGTFSFIIKSKNQSIAFDIIFINHKNIKNIPKEVQIIKSFLEFVSVINYLIDSYREDLKDKREEIKNLYSKTKKLEEEITIYHNKISELENKINYTLIKEKLFKYINSLVSINSLEKKIEDFSQIVDEAISYKINSIVILFFNKVASKFVNVILWNIPTYFERNVFNKLREIEKNYESRELSEFLSYFRVIHKEEPLYEKFIKKFFEGAIKYSANFKSIINVPIKLYDDVIGSILLFFNTKIELNPIEIDFLEFLSKELSRRLRVIKNQEILEKIRYIYALFQEFLENLYFQDNLTFNEIFNYIQVIFHKLGFKNILVYKERKEFFLSNLVEFNLQYCSSKESDFVNSIKIPRELLYSFEKIMIFEKGKDYEYKYQFVEYFLRDGHELMFFIPFSNVTYSDLNYEYSNFFLIALSDKPEYTQFDVQIFTLIQKILSFIYNNIFLYYTNIRDKKILFEVFEVMQDGIIVMDLEKKINFINKSALKILEINHREYEIIRRKYNINDLLSDKMGELIQILTSPEELMKKYIENNIESISGESEIELENKNKIINYTISILKYPLTTLPFLFESDYNLDYLIVLKDVTEQKNIEKEKDDFVATISHDIKTPLTTMKGYLSALLKYPDKITPDQRDSYLRVINSEIDRINRMLNNLMDFRKLEGNVLKINPIKFDILKIINKVIEIFRVSYVNFQFEIKTHLDNLIVFADKDKVEQVLHNLLSNAVKYSPTGGKITITVEISSEQKNQYALISVQDQGMGIPQEEIDKIFEKYYRIKEATKKRVSGKGLGLYITKKIIELHGGKIWAKSQLGKGTTFYFTLTI